MTLGIFFLLLPLIGSSTPEPSAVVSYETAYGSELAIVDPPSISRRRDRLFRLRRVNESELLIVDEDMMFRFEIAQALVFFAPCIAWMLYGFTQFMNH